MVSTVNMTRLRRTAQAAACLAVLTLAAGAQAQTVTFNGITAQGNYILDGGAATPLLDTVASGPGFVDVLQFDNTGISGAFLHSYGGSSGIFGSRSSGAGVYDVTGSFNISLNIRNDQTTAQRATFDFYITPGILQVETMPLTGGQFMASGVSFEILAGTSSVFSSSASLLNNASGLSFNTTGTNIYGGAGASRTVLGSSFSVDLGVLAAGESVDLSYTIGSYARGDAVFGSTYTVPARTEIIPGYWTTACEEVATLVDAPTPDAVPTCGDPFFVPEQVIQIPEQVFTDGGNGSSIASSGDPFALSLGPGQLALPASQNGSTFNVAFTPVAANPNPSPNPVPEPGALSLVLLALAGAGLASRKRSA